MIGRGGFLFDKLKNVVGDATIKKATDELGPVVAQKLQTVLHLNASEVADDAQFRSRFVDPTLLALKAASSGVIALIPHFDDRFTRAMLHLRNELIIIDPEKDTVRLVPDVANRLPKVLLEGLKVPAP
jgi:hypothetical protein